MQIIPAHRRCHLGDPAAEKIVFVGDAVLKGQPPFLAHADLPTVDRIAQAVAGAGISRAIRSSAGAAALSTSRPCRPRSIPSSTFMTGLTSSARKSRRARHGQTAEQSCSRISRFPWRGRRQYLHRLRYGLRHYYVRHYHPIIEADHGGTVTKPLFEVTRGRMVESSIMGPSQWSIRTAP